MTNKTDLRTIEFISNPTEDDYSIIITGINQYAAGRGMPATGACFWVVRDEHSQPIAALSGFNNFGPVEISGFWVDERYRSQGYGSAMLAKVEEWAREKSCTMLTVFTIKDWPACEWYQRHGFVIEHQRQGHVNGTTGCYLIKHL